MTFSPHTLTEKIISAHVGREVFPGEFVLIPLDLILCHEVTTPPAIRLLKQHNLNKVFNPQKIVVTPDHFVPARDEKSAILAKELREWAQQQKIKKYYELGRGGVCHAVLLEDGHVGPGMTVIAGDSHTCAHGVVGALAFGIGSTDLAFGLATGKVWLEVPKTIRVNITGKLKKGVTAKDIMLEIIRTLGVAGATDRVLEFGGSVIRAMAVEDRVPLSNMAIEAGATTGLIEPDEKTWRYVKEHGWKMPKPHLPPHLGGGYSSDPDSHYDRVVEINVSKLTPVVAFPHLPSNVHTIAAARKKKIKIDQGVIGSCTNGRIEDLRIAAKILKNKKVASSVRLIIIPATVKIWQRALQEGLLKIFSEAGAVVSTPTCGPCLGGHMGVLAPGERAISSTNRNFIGRMGSKDSEVYLASPETVARSCVKGFIC
jgi:3-isopropylmalate/(R)-2-methylmalate dehydratase large subunit